MNYDVGKRNVSSHSSGKNGLHSGLDHSKFTNVDFKTSRKKIYFSKTVKIARLSGKIPKSQAEPQNPKILSKIPSSGGTDNKVLTCGCETADTMTLHQFLTEREQTSAAGRMAAKLYSQKLNHLMNRISLLGLCINKDTKFL